MADYNYDEKEIVYWHTKGERKWYRKREKEKWIMKEKFFIGL